jgi:hypothetical protein
VPDIASSALKEGTSQFSDAFGTSLKTVVAGGELAGQREPESETALSM